MLNFMHYYFKLMITKRRIPSKTPYVGLSAKRMTWQSNYFTWMKLPLKLYWAWSDYTSTYVLSCWPISMQWFKMHGLFVKHWHINYALTLLETRLPCGLKTDRGNAKYRQETVKLICHTHTHTRLFLHSTQARLTSTRHGVASCKKSNVIWAAPVARETVAIYRHGIKLLKLLEDMKIWGWS